MVKKADLTGPIEPLVVSAQGACVMLDCSLDTLYGLLNTGTIESYLDGHARKVVVTSIKAYVARRETDAESPCLNENQRSFVTNMLDRSHWPSKRQLTWLIFLYCKRFGVRTA